jgi:hypothetical protein
MRASSRNVRGDPASWTTSSARLALKVFAMAARRLCKVPASPASSFAPRISSTSASDSRRRCPLLVGQVTKRHAENDRYSRSNDQHGLDGNRPKTLSPI